MITDSKYLENIFSEEAYSSLFSEETEEVDNDKEENVDNEDEGVASLARMGGIELRKKITRATREKRLGGMYYKDGQLMNYHEDSDIDNTISTKPSSGGANEDGSTTNKSNQASDAAMDKAIDAALKESHYRKNIRLSEYSDNSYEYSASYEEYIESCIDSEDTIRHFIYHGLNESTAIEPLHEAEVRLQDTVAKKWDGFLQFVNGIIDRFWKAMDSIVMSRKSYLEKYQKIIKDKPPREDIEIEYAGDYESGTDRIRRIHLPPFQYNVHADALRQNGYKPIIEKTTIAGNGFNYEDKPDSNLAKAFKNYFIGMNTLDGEEAKKHQLSNIKMDQLYTWLYNSQDLVNILKRDRAALNQSRNALVIAVQKAEIGKRAGSVEKVEKNTTPPPAKESNNTTPTGGEQKGTEEAYADTSEYWITLSEAGENNAGDNKQEDKPAQAGDTNLNITSTDPNNTDKDGNIENKTTADPKKTEKQDIDNIVNKWINLNRCFLTGKLTAIQTISRDYMKLIAQHVASYGGSTPGEEQNKKQQEQKEGQPAGEEPAANKDNTAGQQQPQNNNTK